MKPFLFPNSNWSSLVMLSLSVLRASQSSDQWVSRVQAVIAGFFVVAVEDLTQLIHLGDLVREGFGEMSAVVMELLTKLGISVAKVCEKCDSAVES